MQLFDLLRGGFSFGLGLLLLFFRRGFSRRELVFLDQGSFCFALGFLQQATYALVPRG